MPYARTYPSPGYDLQNKAGTLFLCSLTPEQHARTCRYWYTVTDNATAHTAFRTVQALRQWLAQRGLSMSADLPAQGEHSCQRLIGSYRTEMHSEYGSFYSKAGTHTRELSNGQYTLGIISTDADGIRTVHTLNPNCHQRPVFDWTESDEMKDRGL